MNDFDTLRQVVWSLIVGQMPPPTPDHIKEMISRFRMSCPDVTDDDADALALSFENRLNITLTPAPILSRPFRPWLDRKKRKIDWYYWNRYRKFLQLQKHFSPRVIAEIDNDTDRIVGHLQDPSNAGKWDRRGMVMGHVQSGKTGNYIGVVAKAADAGYRVIIVIAGVQNRLRSQTQTRLDEGFIGYDTGIGISASGRQPVGVGHFGLERTPATFTTAINDFKKVSASHINIPLKNLSEPVILIIKKETSILTNLIEWLTTHNAHYLQSNTISEPMILIDDEADNASINIKKDAEDVSTINGLIRKLLGLFSRNAYIGYTATPFANILIDPDDDDSVIGRDLFPRDFIVSLNAPSNYFGADYVFSNKNLHVVQSIEDHRDILPMSHKIDYKLSQLPNSLCEAVRTFFLAKAIRILRGQANSHNSMLVNVSRFVAVQRQVRSEVHALVSSIGASVRVHAAQSSKRALRDPEIRAFRDTFEKQFSTTAGVGWDEVLCQLTDAVDATRIVEINNQSSDTLMYSEYSDSGWTVIAVGGFSLSRGLTLEGLTVSYVLRRSMMYDTLFQMGRWFGYRDGYRDLCRVWMPDEARGWYEHIAESIEELREELLQMERAKATPEKFGLKVRSHPEWLIVTARNKMGSGVMRKVEIGLSNRFVETTVLHNDPSSVQGNLQAVRRLLTTITSVGLGPEGWRDEPEGCLVQGVPVKIVDAFLMTFKNHPGSLLSQKGPLRKYISRRKSELERWDVLFAGLREATPRSLVYQLPGLRVVCQRRKAGSEVNDLCVSFAAKRRVASRGWERVGIDRSKRERAETEWKTKEKSAGRDAKRSIPDFIYRRVRERPLLIIHLLAIGSVDDDLSAQTPVVAWSISFPKTDKPERRVEYVVNKTWFRDFYGDADWDDDVEG